MLGVASFISIECMEEQEKQPLHKIGRMLQLKNEVERRGEAYSEALKYKEQLYNTLQITEYNTQWRNRYGMVLGGLGGGLVAWGRSGKKSGMLLGAFIGSGLGLGGARCLTEYYKTKKSMPTDFLKSAGIEQSEQEYLAWKTIKRLYDCELPGRGCCNVCGQCRLSHANRELENAQNEIAMKYFDNVIPLTSKEKAEIKRM